MRRAIVHIGVPRTGTTSFQRLLASRRSAFAIAGILYPELTPPAACEHHLSHQHLGEALDGRRPRGERGELLSCLERQLGMYEIVLLSYESLCLLPWWRRAPARLAALFARQGYAMEIVATVKPQAELLNSTYTWRMQFLREGRAFRDFFEAEVGSAKLDLERLIGRWTLAAEGRLTLVPVRDRRSDRPLIARIFEDLGLADRTAFLSTDDETIVENRSPGPLAIAIDRELHRLGEHRRLGARAREVTRRVEAAVHAAGFDATRFNGLDAARRGEAEARWRAANDRLARQAWGVPWGERVADEAPAPVNDIVPDALKGAAREAFATILASVRAELD